jgi:hypothetical protein
MDQPTIKGNFFFSDKNVTAQKMEHKGCKAHDMYL